MGMPQSSFPGERQALLANGFRGPLRRWRRLAAGAVLLVQMLERATFFGVSSNLVLYLTGVDLAWPGGQASRAELTFLGASYLLAPVGGWLADVYLGRYLAIALSLLLYLAASALLAATACPDGRLSFCGEATPLPGPRCAPTLYCALLLIALATSSVRSNLTSFGADQVSSGELSLRRAESRGQDPNQVSLGQHRAEGRSGTKSSRTQVSGSVGAVAPDL